MAARDGSPRPATSLRPLHSTISVGPSILHIRLPPLHVFSARRRSFYEQLDDHCTSSECNISLLSTLRQVDLGEAHHDLPCASMNAALRVVGVGPGPLVGSSPAGCSQGTTRGERRVAMSPLTFAPALVFKGSPEAQHPPSSRVQLDFRRFAKHLDQLMLASSDIPTVKPSSKRRPCTSCLAGQRQGANVLRCPNPQWSTGRKNQLCVFFDRSQWSYRDAAQNHSGRLAMSPIYT